MKQTKRRGLPFRRKKEQKTDYKNRLDLLKAEKPRIVIRRSLKNILIQAVNYHPDGDKVMMTVSSREIRKIVGGKTVGKNITIAYMTGLLAGKKAKEKKVTEAIIDLGLKKPHKKGVVMAAVKGIVDAGVNVPYEETKKDDIFPPADRLSGQHLKHKIPFEEIKAKIMK